MEEAVMNVYTITLRDLSRPAETAASYEVDAWTWRVWAHYIFDNSNLFRETREYIFVDPGPEGRAVLDYHILIGVGQQPSARVGVWI